MLVYRESDVVPASAWQRLAVTDRGHWVVGLMLIVFGVSVIVPEGFERTSDMPLLSAIGFGLTLTLLGIAFIARTSAKLQRWGHRHRLLIAAAMVTVFTLTFGPMLLTGLAAPFALGFALNLAFLPVWFIQRRNARRIAAAMHRARLQGGAQEPARSARTRKPSASLDVVVMDNTDLAPLEALAPRVTAHANIAGLPPIRTLLLYNFFSKAQRLQTLPVHGWRLHGPVYQLASPMELARAGGYDLDQAEAVGSRLLTTPQQIEEFLSRQDETPLAPNPTPGSWWRRRQERWKSRLRDALGLPPAGGLPEVFSTTGAYPQHVLHCTDGSWKHGVAALCKRCDWVVVDAAEFSAERQGLGWEIQRLIDTVPLNRVIVLIDGFTELPALVEQFRRAWADCAEDSPNQTASAPMLRMLTWHGDDHGAWDGAGDTLGALPEDIQDSARLRIHHCILQLLRAEAALP